MARKKLDEIDDPVEAVEMAAHEIVSVATDSDRSVDGLLTDLIPLLQVWSNRGMDVPDLDDVRLSVDRAVGAMEDNVYIGPNRERQTRLDDIDRGVVSGDNRRFAQASRALVDLWAEETDRTVAQIRRESNYVSDSAAEDGDMEAVCVSARNRGELQRVLNEELATFDPSTSVSYTDDATDEFVACLIGNRE